MENFVLSHPDIKCIDAGNIFSLNFRPFLNYPQPVQQYINHLQLQTSADDRYTLRYAGSLVADLHRNLIKGGIFLYPPTKSKPDRKLRLMYECNPFAYIYTKAGGKAIDGNCNILDIQPQNIHQRSASYIGCRNMTDDLIAEI